MLKPQGSIGFHLPFANKSLVSKSNEIRDTSLHTFQAGTCLTPLSPAFKVGRLVPFCTPNRVKVSCLLLFLLLFYCELISRFPDSDKKVS